MKFLSYFSHKFHFIAALGLLFLSSCSILTKKEARQLSGTNQKPIATIVGDDIVLEEETQSKSFDQGSNMSSTEGAPTDLEIVDENESQDGDKPAVKTGLQATNPTSVNLISGGLQFVEFFAFW